MTSATTITMPFQPAENTYNDTATPNDTDERPTWINGEFVNPITGNFHLQVIFTTCYIIVFAACFFGNLAVLLVILRNHTMRTRTNFFLANLAVADFCVSIFCIFPNMAIFYSNVWFLGRAMCKLYYFVNQMSYTTSITLLTLISLERYIAIMHPLKAQRLITMRRLKISLFLVWITTAVYNSPQFVLFDIVEFSDFTNITYCFNSSTETRRLYRWYHLFNFIIFYVTPLLLMSFVYMRISLVLWRTSSGNTSSGTAVDYVSSRESHNTRYSSVTGATDDNKTETIVNKRGRVRTMKRYCADTQRDSPISNNVRFEYNSDNTEHESITSIDKDRPEAYELTRINCSRNQYGSANTYAAYRGAPSPARLPGKQLYNSTSPLVTRGKRSQLSASIISSTPEPKVNAMVARRKVIRLLVAVVASFAVCMLPYHVLIFLKNWNYSKYVPALYPPISYLILHLNSGINPILYALLSDKFRRSLRDMLHCR